MSNEIRLGGTYSNQVASLGDKVDALVLSLGGRDYMIDAEITELEHQVDRLEFKVDNLVLDVRKFSDKLDLVLKNLPNDNTFVEKSLADWYYTGVHGNKDEG